MSNKMEKEVQNIVDLIIKDYTKESAINKGDLCNQPYKEEIISIIQNLQYIIFPGYFGHKVLKCYHVEYQLGATIEDVTYKLNRQISFALRYSPDYIGKAKEIVDEAAEEITISFMKKIPEIRDCLETDVQAAYEGDPAAYSKDEIIFSYPGIYAVMINRIAHELYKLQVPLIPRIMTEHAHSVTGIDIHPGATIGKYFFIDHGTGIVIGETTQIGEHVKIYQGVTLGAVSTKGGQTLKGQKRHPTIEDGVTIYSGASILGGNTIIGEEVVIGSNAFVTGSVPSKTKVSTKNPELQFKTSSKAEFEVKELIQNGFLDYII
ncbi:serine O-acetyltransferase EpsC [Konateibacter massiliensis]|uniref:serine O-acetyltransferase EpsC n=1 Tax=Konateibacter massiliensis TaxID=2002841 RepID=UPI001F30D42F|nr:serine O-acetyltransferase EpsC [Konateibacter massiliensis]